MMNADMSLKIIRPRILVFTVRTKWTNISRGSMYKAMTNHFVLSLETFATLASRASSHGAIVWSTLRVNICV
jgi:hypothetical protein